MCAFIRLIDEKTWDTVEDGWTGPCEVGGNAKIKSKWIADEKADVGFNSKELNAIFSTVDMNVFRLMSTCLVDKDAWKILETNYEGTNKVRLQRLQLLTTRFEEHRMLESETIGEFNSNPCYISNECYALGEKLSKDKLERKVLRSLPRRFKYKVIAIEEAKDITTMRLDELIGSLRAFEISLKDDDLETEKEIGFSIETSAGLSEKKVQK